MQTDRSLAVTLNSHTTACVNISCAHTNSVLVNTKYRRSDTQPEDLHRDAGLILGLVNNVLELRMLCSIWLSGVTGLQDVNWKAC